MRLDDFLLMYFAKEIIFYFKKVVYTKICFVNFLQLADDVDTHFNKRC